MAETEVYLFTGPEIGEKNEAVSNIKAAAKKKYGDIEEYKYYTADVRIEDVIAQMQNASLFSPALFITLRNAENIKTEAEISSLVSWIKSGSDSPNTLVLLSEENSISKKIENAIPSSKKKIFWEMFENRKEDWVKSFFKKNGFGVTDEAVVQILDMVENNTEALKNECSRFFFCFEKGHVISEADVDKILSHNREENAFTLFDAMAESGRTQSQRFESSLEILQKISSQKSSSAVALIAGLTYCFRQLKNFHELYAGGVKPTDVQLKGAGFGSKKQQEKYLAASKVWTTGATSSILALLANTDIKIRETGTVFEDTYMQLFLYSVIMKNGLFMNEYE